jgi:hypothetical protein
MTLATTINELFLSDGLIAWLGLLILIVFLVALVGAKRELVVIGLPVLVLMGLTYLTAGLGWHFIISIISVIFLMVTATRKD